MFNLLNTLFAAIVTIAIMSFMVLYFGRGLGISILVCLLLIQQVAYRVVKGYWQV
jgi:hypothetical protein|tara:strand:+ start:3043 stop:3207 length:165 start_codon:yes stop_codon:yes gene_type:complete